MNITEIKAHDAATYELLVTLDKVERHADYALNQIHNEAGDRQVSRSYRDPYRWQLTDDEAIAKVEAKVADPRHTWQNGKFADSPDHDDSFWAYISKKAQGALDAYIEAQAEIHDLNVQIQTQEAVFRANWWARFEAVPGGHIHNRNATCHTLRPTTLVAWIPSLSGDTEADAVAQYGPALCSHCFKSAPVEWQQQAKVQKDSEGNVLTLAEAQKIADEKAAAKAEREAKKAAREAKAAARAAKRG